MEVNTTDPGVQFYTGNFLDETEKGKGRAVYNKNAVFCLETEKYPVLNQPKTKKVKYSGIIRPGETYSPLTYTILHGVNVSKKAVLRRVFGQ